MGCTTSFLQGGGGKGANFNKKKKMNIPEVVVFVPTIQVPVQSDHTFHKALKGLIPRGLIDRLVALRNRIIFIAEDTGGSAINEIKHALEEYLSLLLGLTKKEYSLEELVEFKWRNLDDKRQETCISNSWFEVLLVLYALASCTLSEADSLLIPKETNVNGSIERTTSTDCRRDAIDLLIKAPGYYQFCLKNILAHLDPHVKKKLPKEFQEGALEALSLQALGQGTELQLGLAIDNQKATLSVKRRLACEQLTYFSQAHFCLSGSDVSQHDDHHDDGRKHSTFIRWKYLEAKAAAYYYHGLILDKGSEPQSHISAVCCFLAAEELLTQSKKACLSFCLAAPVTRAPPPYGVMKHLTRKIPDVALKRSQMYGYLLDQEKGLNALPELPEFQLSLRPDDYELPPIDPAWNREKWECLGQPLQQHLNDSSHEDDDDDDNSRE